MSARLSAGFIVRGECWQHSPRAFVCADVTLGLANAPGGWAYEPTISSIRILPPEDYDGDRQLVSQERQIRPDRSAKAGEASIRANLYLEPRSPTQRLEVR